MEIHDCLLAFCENLNTNILFWGFLQKFSTAKNLDYTVYNDRSLQHQHVQWPALIMWLSDNVIIQYAHMRTLITFTTSSTSLRTIRLLTLTLLMDLNWISFNWLNIYSHVWFMWHMVQLSYKVMRDHVLCTSCTQVTPQVSHKILGTLIVSQNQTMLIHWELITAANTLVQLGYAIKHLQSLITKRSC